MSKWNEETISIGIKLIIDKLGRFPSCLDLRNECRHDLINAIRREGKGLGYYQAKFGFGETRKKVGYWEDDENIDKEFSNVINNLGHFPTQIQLCELGFSQMVHSINKKNRTLNDYRLKFGFSFIERNKKYWKNWDNLAKELTPFISNNKFPTCSMIENNLGGGAIRSITYFGGIAKVAERMGYKPSYFHTTSDGHYVHSSHEYLLDEFLSSRGIKHDVNGLISDDSKLRYDFKIDDIYVEIWGFCPRRNQKIDIEYRNKRAKKEKFYKDKNLKLISIECDIFKNPLDEIENYFIDLFSKLGFDTSIKKEGFTLHSVTNHIQVWNEDRIVEEIKKFIDLNDRFPKSKDLGKNQSLLGAITKYGGFNYYANKFGFDCRRKAGYWSEERIIEELQKIIDVCKTYPTYSQFQKLNAKLYYAMYDLKGKNGRQYFKKFLTTI